MDAPPTPPHERRRGRLLRGRDGRPRSRLGVLLAALIVAGLVAFALTRLNLHRVGHALITASFGPIAAALALMGASLVLRAISWHATLLAALPDSRIPFRAVVRATMIGVMGSAVFPGRIGEPSRVIVLARRLEGSNRRLIPIVAGTVFSQTLINLLALAVLAGVTFSNVPLLRGHPAGVAAAFTVPLLVCALVLAGPRLLTLAQRSRSTQIKVAALALARLLTHARSGLAVFARPRAGVAAVAFQLAAWALQWLACYMVLDSLGLTKSAGLVSAAAILLAVNVSAVLPATPSNVGVFQAACLVVLTAYEVAAGPAVAYGILLQAVEVVTALTLGVPALLREGLTWRDIRPAEDP
jgi:phosphatidylinositol alpha-mannosyltransferase